MHQGSDVDGREEEVVAGREEEVVADAADADAAIKKSNLRIWSNRVVCVTHFSF